MLRFPAEIGEFGHRRLHAERHFILADARLNFRINAFFGQHAVKPLDFFDDLPLRALANTFGIADVVNGVAFRLKKNAFEFGWQETA